MANILTLTRITNGAQADGSSTNAFQVKVTNSSTGAPVASSVVTLSVTSGATLGSTSVTTNAYGVANGMIISSTAGSYTVTASQSGAGSVSGSVIFTTAQETAAAQRVQDTLQSTLAATAGAGYVGYDDTQTYSSGTLGAALNTGLGELNAQGEKLARYIDIEDYADAHSAAGDWTTAIQAAFDDANTVGIYDIRGTGQYTVSGTLFIRAVPATGMNISIYKLGVSSAFPSNNTFWDATPVISIGQASGNIVGLNLSIDYLDGGSVADGVNAIENGFGVSNINIGFATNCISVIRMGEQQYTSATNWVTGHYWVNNWLGVYLANGTGASAPIVEGWIIDVEFIAGNRWGGIWYFNAGQYGQIRGDWDYNGAYLGVIELSDTTGLASIAGKTGLKLTDGTTEMEFLFYYNYQGSTYAVVAASTNISKTSAGSGALPWTAGSTLSCTTVSGVALVFSTSQIAGDNDSGTNYFDVLHDFERAPFGKIQVVAGYLSGIIGGSLFSSSFQYQNSFSGNTDSIRGFGVTNSGEALSFYNYALSSLPIANFTADFVNFQNKLYQADFLYEGVPVAQTYAASGTPAVHTYLKNPDKNKYLGEGCMYDITLKTNFATCGSFRVYVIGGTGAYSHVVVSSFVGDAITVTFTDTDDGVALNFSQAAQQYMQVVTNVIRI